MLYQHKLSALMASVIMCSSSLSLPAANAQPGVGVPTMATLTAKHGEVFKRDFKDWNREEWGEPETANVTDQLREGMQIGTGSDSWAEVTWPSVKTRAWANTVFAVAPAKRLVYLTGGEMLFRLDKNRKDKDPYYIWTKVLQARIRGTTVLVQTKGNKSRITVMEGKIDVYNRLDHSSVTLTPGTVLEVKGYKMEKRGSIPLGTPTANTPEVKKSEPVKQDSKQFSSSIKDICYDGNNFVPLFQDNNASTNLYAANKEALINHPLVNVGEKLDSLPLVQTELAACPGYSQMLPFKTADQLKLNRTVYDSVEVKGLPSNVSYCVGQSVGKAIKVPQAAFAEIPPIGVILQNAGQSAPLANAPRVNTAAPPPVVIFPVPMPMQNTPEQSANATAEKTTTQTGVSTEAFFKPFYNVPFEVVETEPPLPVSLYQSNLQAPVVPNGSIAVNPIVTPNVMPNVPVFQAPTAFSAGNVTAPNILPQSNGFTPVAGQVINTGNNLPAANVLPGGGLPILNNLLQK
jgi:hypothetical protein